MAGGLQYVDGQLVSDYPEYGLQLPNMPQIYKIPKILVSPHFPVLEGLLPLTVTEVHSADQTVM